MMRLCFLCNQYFIKNYFNFYICFYKLHVVLCVAYSCYARYIAPNMNIHIFDALFGVVVGFPNMVACITNI